MPLDKETEEFLIRFGERVREIRLSQGLTLEMAEEKGDVSWRHLQRIENGKNINLSTVYKISKLYKLKISKLLEEL